MSHCRKCGDAGDDALFTVSLPAGVEEDRRLVAHWLPIAPNGCWRCSRRKLPLTPVHARRSRALGRSRSMASGQTTSALLPGRLTQPRARSVIRLPQPPLARRPTQRRLLTPTQAVRQQPRRSTLTIKPAPPRGRTNTAELNTAGYRKAPQSPAVNQSAVPALRTGVRRRRSSALSL